MVHIHTGYCDACCFDDLVEELRYDLPDPLMRRAYAYKFEKDRVSYLLGKKLLLRAARVMGYSGLRLRDLLFNKFHKPYFNSDFQFNISHSGNIVLCVASRHCCLGVDVEAVKDVCFEEFHQCFTASEWSCIYDADKPMQRFFEFWTRKEAVIKADGRGMQIPLQHFEVIANEVTIDLHHYFIQPIPIDTGYVSHLVTDISIHTIINPS